MKRRNAALDVLFSLHDQNLDKIVGRDFAEALDMASILPDIRMKGRIYTATRYQTHQNLTVHRTAKS